MADHSPIRIVFCITELDVGGAERALVTLATGLDPEQFSPTVICLGPEAALCEPLREAGIDVHCLNAKSIFNVDILFRLIGLLRKLKPQILQTFLFHANILGRIAGWFAGVKYVLSGIRVAEKRSRWYLRIDRWTNFLVTKNVCVSQAVANFTIQEGGIRAEKVCVIPNGVDIERFDEATPLDLMAEFGIPKDASVMVFVGRLDPQKGIRVLMEALPNILREFPIAHFLFVGEGGERPWLEQQIAELDVGSRIHLVGFRGDIPAILKASNLLVLPSLWEGMPNVLLEAMAAALPVVATDVQGVSEVLQDGKLGVIVPPCEADELTAGIRSLLQSSDHRNTLSNSSYLHVKANFTTRKMICKYADLYLATINSESKN